MTEKEFLNVINNVDEKFLNESYEIYEPLSDDFNAGQVKISEFKSGRKRRILIRPLIYTAAILAVAVGLSVFSRYDWETESRVQGTNDAQTESDVPKTDDAQTESDIPKTDDAQTESELIYGNITLNSKMGSPIGGMICPSEQGLYFSNLRDEEKIYCTKNGQSKLVVDMPARFINYYGGKLYFISPNYKCSIYDNAFAGKPYSYDIITDELKELTNSEAVTSLTVTNEGIYYNKIANNSSSLEQPELWFMDLDGQNPRQCGYTYALRSGDNIIDTDGIHALTEDRLNIALDISGSVIEPELLAEACVYDNKLITRSDETVSITDIIEGTTHTYGAYSAISDYVILKDKLYIAFNSSNLLRIDLSESDGSIQKLISTNPDMIYSKLYTDGTFLYALGSNSENNDFYIAQLSIGTYQITKKELK